MTRFPIDDGIRDGDTERLAVDTSLDDGIPVVTGKNISKHFGHVTALDEVNFELYDGEITALVGDNGAGKSTLVSILAGVLQPDSGYLQIAGETVRLTSPAQALDLGISTVFQDLSLVPQRDVAANVFAGREPTRFGFFVDRKQMNRDARDLIADLSVNLPAVTTMVSSLSGGQRQATAIVRALGLNASVLLLDEPTAAMGVRESRRIIELVKKLPEAGHSVLLISHNLETVFDIADRIIVLRHGKKRADVVTSKTNREEIVAVITGAKEQLVV